jgi:hypothetical protein
MREPTRARRLLDRASFGARPGELAALGAEGPEAWLARQLVPASIDDGACEARLAALARSELASGLLEAPLPRRLENADPAALVDRLRRVGGHAVAVRLVRVVHGRRELQEVMVDFWANHFSVSARKGPVALWLTRYNDSTIRFFLALGAAPAYRNLLLSTHDPINAAFPDRYKRYIRSSSVHTAIQTGLYYSLATNGIPLYQWIADFVNEQPGWVDNVE